MANHRPEVEAHDLLYSLFSDRASGYPGGLYIRELGLSLTEHPNTPRLAIAKLDHEGYLPRLSAELAKLTRWVTIDLSPAETGDEL